MVVSVHCIMTGSSRRFQSKEYPPDNVSEMCFIPVLTTSDRFFVDAIALPPAVESVGAEKLNFCAGIDSCCHGSLSSASRSEIRDVSVRTTKIHTTASQNRLFF